MTISDLSARLKYDISFVGPDMEIDWAIDVDRKFVMDAVQEILIAKEKDTEGVYNGEIIIRPTSRIAVPQYHGRECEEDIVDSGGRVVGHISSAGRARAHTISDCSHLHKSLESLLKKNQNWRENFEWEEDVQLSDTWRGLRNTSEENAPGIGNTVSNIMDRYRKWRNR